MTQIGLMLEGQNGLNWGHWQKILKLAEELGFQCVFRSDHFTNPSPPDLDSLELWTSLTYAASHTSQLEFGSLVAPVTFRHPAMNVRYAAAVHELSGGRFFFGMGAGWQEREHHNWGIPFYDFKTRFERFEEALEMTKRLWESAEPVTFQGKHFSLNEAILLPRRPSPAPILIGGNGAKKTLPLVAKYAIEWNAVFIQPETYQERTEQLNELLEQGGRKPVDVKRSLMTQIRYNATEDVPANMIGGTGAAIVEQIGQWVEMGVQRFMLQWLDLDDLAGIEGLAKDVLPHFH